MRKEWEKLLKQRLEKDKTTLIKLTRKDNEGNEVDLGTDLDSIKVRRSDVCTILCSKCNKLHTLAVREVIKKSSFCRNCKRHAYNEKKGYITWSIDSLWDFFNEKKEPGKNSYTWWRNNYSNFVAALQNYRAQYPNAELPFISRKQSRTAGGKHLWKEVLEVYEDEGVKGLTKTNINNNKKNFYTFITNKKIIPKTGNKGNVNYPCIEVCKKLKEVFPEICSDILDERKEYLKRTFPRECESFEEMCEIHIRPILNEMLKADNLNGSLLTQHSFEENNHCNIVNAWKNPFKKNIYDLRKYFDLPICSNNKCVSYQIYICDSMCEMRVYNFLYLRNIELNEHQNYKGDLSTYIDDGRFYSEIKQKWIVLEIFGDKRGDYEERKKQKIKYWEENEAENEELLALTYDDTTKKSKLIEIFEPYIGILEEKELTDDFLEEMKKCNYNNIYLQRRNEIINEAKEIKKNAPDGFLPPISELPTHIKSFIHGKRFDGGVDDFRKLLGEDIKEAKKVGRKKQRVKAKKTLDNRTPEQKQAAKENKIKGIKNRTEEQKKITRKKISEAAKKRLANPKNNPMYGKKGKDNPNFGKKYGSFDYKKKFLPIFAELLTELDKNNENDIIFITESLWVKHSKKIKDCPETPYRNPGEYNPWSETGFDGFFEDTKQYIVEKNININSRLMKVENTRWAKLHFKRRKDLIDFIEENNKIPNRKENKTLYEWYRSLINRPRSDQEYLKDGKKAIDDAIKKFTNTTAT